MSSLSLGDIQPLTDYIQLRHLEVYANTDTEDVCQWQLALLALIRGSTCLETVLAPNLLVFEAIHHLAKCRNLRVLRKNAELPSNTAEAGVIIRHGSTHVLVTAN